MISLLNKAELILGKIEKTLLIISFSMLVIFSFSNVILRALYTKFNIQFANTLLNSIDWSDPFARLMVLWVTFLGASLLTGDNKHIRIDFLGHFLSPSINIIREIILSIACIAVCGLMLHASVEYIKMEMEYSTSSIMGISAWKWQLIIPFGFCLITFRFFILFLKELFKLTGKKA